jgi:hypothetical protein
LHLAALADLLETTGINPYLSMKRQCGSSSSVSHGRKPGRIHDLRQKITKQA